MDLLQLLLVVALAVAAVAYLIISRKSDYKKQLDQLKPEPAGKAKKWVKPTEMKLFTAEEVAKHNKSDDAWIIVRDRQTGVSKVYDVTSYVDEHPGGESILNNAGKDSTKGFYGPQHPDTVFVMFEEFCVGTLQPQAE